MTVEATSASGAVVTYTSPATSDAVDGAGSASCSAASGTTFALGTTQVTCTKSDAAGNAAIPTNFDVIVQDTTAPVIALVGSDPVSVEYGSVYSDAGATASDSVDGNISASVIKTGSVGANVGTYTLHYNISDAANNAATEVTRTVNVTAKPITVTAVTNTKNHDGTNSAAGIPTINVALVGTDTNGFTETYDNADVGTNKVLTPSGLVNDGNGGNNYSVTFASVSTGTILSSTQTTPNNDGVVTVDSTTPGVVITNPTQPVSLTISGGTTDPTIDVSSFISGGTGTLPQITITAANAGNANVEIPASTVVTSADTTWNGVIAAPTVTTVSVPVPSGDTVSSGLAIEVGFTGAKLSFDKAVKILLPGQAGKRAGYIRTGISFTEITNPCVSRDNQAAIDADLVGGKEDCKIDAANLADMIIWTKHFTSFTSYTQSVQTSGGGGGGGGGGIVGSYGVSIVQPAVLAQVPQVAPATTGQVLGASTYRFGLALRIGSRGDEVTELQNRLISEGVYSGPVTGYFGSLTAQAVKAFQAKYGIGQDGTVGQQTRDKLNNATSTAPEVSSSGREFGQAVSAFARNLAMGSRGDDVTALQNRLTSEGVYSGPITGYFGSLTAQAVKAFQAKYGIAQAGKVGPLTREVLNKNK